MQINDGSLTNSLAGVANIDTAGWIFVIGCGSAFACVMFCICHQVIMTFQRQELLLDEGQHTLRGPLLTNSFISNNNRETPEKKPLFTNNFISNNNRESPDKKPLFIAPTFGCHYGGDGNECG